MPDSPLVSAGAQVQPTNAAALHSNEFFTGLWTQGNPLGPGAVPYLYTKFYSASRFDRLVGGRNIEISTRLTLKRRPGTRVYNDGLSQPAGFPPINRFYEWRGFSAQGESIRIMGSVDPAVGSNQGTVRDVTGPSNNIILWTKDKNAGRTSFVSVGNILYWGDGVDCKLLVQSDQSWGVGPAVAIGTITGTQAVRVTVLEFGFHILQTILICTLAAPAPALVENQDVTFAGVTNAALLNGQDYLYKAIIQTWAADAIGPLAPNQIAFNISNLPSYDLGFPFQSDTGTISSATSDLGSGEFIIDSNGNIQEAVGAQTAKVTNIQVTSHVLPGGATGRQVTLFFDPSTPLTIPNAVTLNLSGLTTVPGLNGAVTGVSVESPLQVQFLTGTFGVPVTAFSVETGTADTGNGVSGLTPPVWNTAVGGITQDGGQQWVNKGPAVMDWGIDAPTTAPTVTQVVAPTVYPTWLATTWYSNTALVIVDSNGNLQQLTTSGTTGGSAPAWATTPVGAITTDNTAHWKLLGPAAWQASHVYALNDVVQNTYTYYINVLDPPTGPPWVPIPRQIAVTVTNAFQCITAGTSGTNQPSWPNGNGTTVTDNGVTWQNIGTAPAWPGAAQNLSIATKILDSNGNVQTPQVTGKTGSAAPTWMTNIGQSTTDGTQTWLLTQNFAPASTGAVQYAYSGKSSVTGHTGTASPLSTPITVLAGNQVVVQGDGLVNPPPDVIVLWRTLQGGSTLFYKDEFPNPGAGVTWIYTDTDISNQGVNELIQAPIAGENNPPPPGFVPQCYYLTRIWGFVGHILQYSNGPDEAGTAGSGDQSFYSGNTFALPSLGVKAWPTSIGLIVYTNSDIFAVLGQGTSSSPFYVITFQEGVGLASQDAFAVNGSTAYGMLTSGQVVSMDPGSGETEVGFPIGDLFNSEYLPAQTYFAWHQGSSADMALYVADGVSGWYRMAAVAAPESGNVWSPKATFTPGVKAIASIETQPGVRALILGPSAYGFPILMRDPSTWQDNLTPYPAFANICPIQLAQPGTVVGVEFIVTEEPVIVGATPVTVGVFSDEIAAPYIYLRNRVKDPPNLPESKTIRSLRHWSSQDANTILPCRYFGQQLMWPAENFPNELLTNTIYGRMPEKSRR